MIVYEKNNKLNINFENSLENPDIEFGKSEIKVDGNNIVSGGGGGGAVIATMHEDEVQRETVLDKTWKELFDAFLDGKQVILAEDSENGPWYTVSSFDIDSGLHIYYVRYMGSDYSMTAQSENGYPSVGWD